MAIMRTKPVPAAAPALPTLRDFAESVATMRRLQQTYFQTRDRKVLDTCRTLEREVDTTCRQILAQRGHLEPTTRSLLDQLEQDES